LHLYEHRVIADITDFIFVADEPCKADVIFIPSGSDPAPPELAAKLYAEGFAPLIIPSGGVSVKTGKFNGVKRNAERITKTPPTHKRLPKRLLLSLRQISKPRQKRNGCRLQNYQVI
jgi:hypothetical protein